MQAKRITFRTLALTAWLSALFCLAPAQADNRLRWFEIEVLVFKQDGSEASDAEVFSLDVQPVPLRNHYDLIGQWRAPYNVPLLASLSECEVEPSQWLPALPVISQDIALPIPASPQSAELKFCRDSRETALVSAWYTPAGFDSTTLPREQATAIVDGRGGDINEADRITPFLMPEDSFELTDIRDQLMRQRGKELLLHTTWRQPVFTRTQGRKIRLFGGENFTHEYRYTGQQLPRPSDASKLSDELPAADQRLLNIEQLLQRIENREFTFVTPDPHAQRVPERSEQDPAWPQDVWEFDGLMHIYLVGNYLHIDGEFNLRDEISLPAQASELEAQARAELEDEAAEIPFLQAYYFQQLRRVISHETHYFDHPEYGVIVQIRRTELSHRR